MAQEFETQILDIDAEAIKNKLLQLGAKEEPEVLQRRWVLDIECLDAKVRGTGEWIRLRQSGQKTTIAYKKRVGQRLDQTEEIEIIVDDFDRAAELLGKLNCWTGKYYQENRRHKFTLPGLEFTLDSWPRIPTLLEIEGDSPEKVKEGLKLLDLEGKDGGQIGVVEIYAHYGIDLHSFPVLKF